MSTSFLITPRSQFFSPTTGSFLSGGKLYSFLAGTTIPVATYPTIKDSLASTNCHTNPVILDSTGCANIVLQDYTKLMLCTSSDEVIWVVDNVNTITDADIYDVNGKLLLSFTGVPEATNYVDIANSASGTPPIITVDGDDTNIGLEIAATNGTVQLISPTVTIDSIIPGVSVPVYKNITGTETVTGAATFNGSLTATSNNLIPSGVVGWFALAAVPAGWLACDGSAVSRATYATLYGVIGNTYGAGDGVTTFNVPTSARRVIMGSGGTGTGTINSVVGSVGGEETHVVTLSEFPAHLHSYNLEQNAITPTVGFSLPRSTVLGPNTVNTSSVGSNGAHNNIQPSIVMLMAIRT